MPNENEMKPQDDLAASIHQPTEEERAKYEAQKRDIAARIEAVGELDKSVASFTTFDDSKLTRDREERERIAALCDAYARWTDSTAMYPVTAEPEYLALGIAEEWGELYEAGKRHIAEDVAKEGGDACWYLARYCTNVLQVSFGLVVLEAMREGGGDAHQVAPNVGVLCGVEKKRIRDGAKWDDAKRAEKQAAAFGAAVVLTRNVIALLGVYGVSLEQALEVNQAKLTRRKSEGVIQGDGDNR